MVVVLGYSVKAVTWQLKEKPSREAGQSGRKTARGRSDHAQGPRVGYAPASVGGVTQVTYCRISNLLTVL